MINKNVLSETYNVLLTLGDEYISKIPPDVFAMIEYGRNMNYSPVIDENKALNEQGLSKRCIALIASLKLDYFSETDEEREKLINHLETNEARFEESLKKEKSILKKIKLIREHESE